MKEDVKRQEWFDFKPGSWTREVNVRSFIQNNYTPYEGDESFLVGATDKTKYLWNEVLELMQIENEKELLMLKQKTFYNYNIWTRLFERK